MQISEAAGGVPAAGAELCRFPKLEECAHFHYERVQLPQLTFSLQTSMDQSLHSQHTNEDDGIDWHMVQVTSAGECWLVQRNYENFKMLDAQLHQCIYDRKISQLPDLSSHPSYGEDVEMLLIEYLARFSSIADNSVNCGPVLNWFQMDNKGHRLLVPSEESRSINTPAVAAAYSVRRYVSQARDELNLEVGDMISVIDMASPAESMWWRGKRGFQVGFFPQHCVHIIGDKVPRNMPLPPPVVGSLALTPVKPVLRKHGKLIAFFRSFILNRPSRRRLKQSGILKERVFGCDLGEHLLNSGHDIPTVLKCCTEFIEKHGIVDGIYRLSGVTSNIQKLRNAFDEDRVPDLYTDEILQDIHSVASLLKMYFRELPNPLCTYQLYQSFVNAVQGCSNINRNSLSDRDRLLKMREAVQKLPPPHYRTLEYLMRHLSRVAQHGSSTGMTTRNIAIVWAPNLLRCAELEVGGVAALQGVGVQAVVTEFLICYADLIFCDHLPSLNHANFDIDSLSPKRSRPKSLAISTPTKLITLEEARTKHLLNKADDSGYIEVGGGPNNLPKKYHTVIELPSGNRKRGLSKRSPLGWRSFFSKSRSSSRSQGSLTKNRKASTPGNISAEKSVTELDLAEMKRKLRPVKSAESLTSGHSEPASTEDVLGPLHCLNKPPGHNRSVSHDSYFDTLQSSQHNSEGSLYDLSEIQLNFELEESEMRIFSEDESLVSSPRVQKDSVHRRVLTRARPEDFSSTNNSNNPSPKKQARVVMSPDSTSRKRTRLEDQLSDIQYIDCNTPDNTCVISTTAVIHSQPETALIESYQPKNKSPRNSEVENKRQSLELEKPEKLNIPKSFTESNIRSKLIIPSNQSSAFASPQSPLYKQLDDSSSNTTPLLSPDFSPSTEVGYQSLNQYALDKFSSDENEKTVTPSKNVYENIVSPVSKKSSPTYENVLTTISITYRSPSKSPKSSICASDVNDNDSVYEDVRIVNPEQAVVPTSAASLPLQQASQPDFQEIDKDNSLTSLPTNFTRLGLPEKEANEQRPKSLSALEDLNKRGDNLQHSFCAVYNIKGASSTNNPSKTCSNPEKSASLSVLSATSPMSSYKLIENAEQLSLTDLSLSEVVQSSTENLNTSQSSISFPISPSKNSLSPNVSPMLFGDDMKTLSQDILTSLSPGVASLLESKTCNSSGSSLLEDRKSGMSTRSSEENENLACLRSDVRQGNPEYLKLTDNNISSNEEDVSPVRFSKSSQKQDFFTEAPFTESIEISLNNLGITETEVKDKLRSESSSNQKHVTDTQSPNILGSTETNVEARSEPANSNPTLQVLDARKCTETGELPLELTSFADLNSNNNKRDERPLDLNLGSLRPTSINLIEFSPSEPTTESPNRIITNDKRKSCETESLDDESSIYQQVKYFRRSIHEINALLDLQDISTQLNDQNVPVSVDNTKNTKREDAILDKDSEVETYDSLEVDNVRIYENVENPTPDQFNPQQNTDVNISLEQISEEVPKAYATEQELPEKPNVRSLTSHFELKETSQKPPIFKRNDYENIGLRSQKPPILLGGAKHDKVCAEPRDNERKCSARDNTRTSKSDYGSSSSLESDRVQKIIYDRGSLPPCLRARHVKNAIKTRSLDEDAFTKEFGVSQTLERRKSVDENFGSKLNTLPKVLNQPKPIPIEGQKLDIHLAHSTDNVSIGNPEQKLNRERIEKYKEERRKFLHDKYRSESFKEDKDILLSRFKHKIVKGKGGEDEIVSKMEHKDARIYASDPGPCSESAKLGTRKKQSESESKPLKTEANFNEFVKDSLECDTNNLNQSNKNESKYSSNVEKSSTCKSKTKHEIGEPPNDFRESIRYKTALFESQANQSKHSSDVKPLGCERNMGKPADDGIKFNVKKVQDYKSPINARKNVSVKETESDGLGDILSESEFIRNRRRDDDGNKGERRRHTYESREREREPESDRVRRISLETRSPRKDAKSPSYCIKDMKAIFESKSQQ